MAVHVVKVDLLGSSFSVQTDESPERFQVLLKELADRHDRLRQATRVTDPLRLSLLTSITLLDELLQARADPGPEAELGELAKRMIERIDSSLIEARDGGERREGP